MFLQRAEVCFQDLSDGSQLSVTPFLGDQTSSGRHWKNMVHIHTWSQHTHSHRVVGMGKEMALKSCRRGGEYDPDTLYKLSRT